MSVTISFIHMDHTPALDERIHEKSEKLFKLVNGTPKVKWTCYVKDLKHYAELNVFGAQVDYHATASSDSLYKTIDLAIEKIERQLVKQKEKRKNKLHRKKEELQILDPENAWTDYDDEEAS